MDLRGLIDADTHVDETDATWEYMPSGEKQFKPVTEIRSNPNASNKQATLREWFELVARFETMQKAEQR